MPMTGSLRVDARARSSAFTHGHEEASPYRYTVHLADSDIEAAIAGTSRAGFLRFQFERPGRSWIVLENNSRPDEGTVTIDSEHAEIYGSNPVHRLYAGSGKPAGFSGYFVVRFDHAFQASGTWSGTTLHPGSQLQTGKDGSPGAYLAFDLKAGETVQVKVGTSFTSVEEARRNLDSEIPDWNYQRVEAAARSNMGPRVREGPDRATRRQPR